MRQPNGEFLPVYSLTVIFERFLIKLQAMRKRLVFLIFIFLNINLLSAQVRIVTLCVGATASLSVPISGVETYQWQIQSADSSGFINVPNSVNYSGATTHTLSISSATSSMYGDKFRCLISDISGLVSGDTSALILQAKWLGASSSFWNDPLNWECGIIPDLKTDAIIQSGNCILNSNGSCRSLLVNAPATLQVLTGFNLIVANGPPTKNELASNVRVIDTLIFRLDNDSTKLSQGIYEYSHATTAPLFNTNEIIVGTTGEGYARKIIAINRQTNITVLQTEQAGLDDIFKNANFSFNLTTDSTGAETTSGMRNNAGSAVGGYTFDLSGSTLFQSGPYKISIPSGQVTLDANWLLDVDYQDKELKSFKMQGNNIGYTSNVNLKLELTGALSLINKEGYLKRFRKTKTIMVPIPIGPIIIRIPVIATLRIDLHYTLSASTTASLERTIAFTSNNFVDLGISYQDNNWQTTYDQTGQTNVSLSGLTAKGSVEVNATITPKVAVSFYGAGGPFASISLVKKIKGNISVGNNLLWDFYAGANLKSEVGAKVKILSKSLFDLNNSWQTNPVFYRTPEKMEIASGNNQEGNPNTYLTQLVRVKVLDNFGFTQQNVQVLFNVTSGGGSVESASAFTDANGIAFTRWKLGANAAEPQELQAVAQRADGAYLASSPLQFSANFSQPYSVTATAGDYQIGTANQNLADPLEVQVNDMQGNPMPNIKVEWSVVKGAGVVTNAATYTNANGKTTNIWKLSSTGEQVVKVVVKKADGVDVNGSPLLFSADLPGMTIVAGGNGWGTAMNQLKWPRGIYVDEAENIYVADTDNFRVMKWTKSSQTGDVIYYRSNSNWKIYSVFVQSDSLSFLINDSYTQGVYKFKLPYVASAGFRYYNTNGYNLESFTVDSAGHVYGVEGNFLHEVRKWFYSLTVGVVITNPSDVGFRVAGGNGAGAAANQLNIPRDVWIDSVGNIYIADAWNYRIQKWAPGATSGVTVAGGNGLGTGPNQFQAFSVCADKNGNVYVADRYNSRILKFTPGSSNGVTIAGGSFGSGPNQLAEPYDIFIRGIYLYVCDRNNNRVMRMRY